MRCRGSCSPFPLDYSIISNLSAVWCVTWYDTLGCRGSCFSFLLLQYPLDYSTFRCLLPLQMHVSPGEFRWHLLQVIPDAFPAAPRLFLLSAGTSPATTPFYAIILTHKNSIPTLKYRNPSKRTPDTPLPHFPAEPEPEAESRILDHERFAKKPRFSPDKSCITPCFLDQSNDKRKRAPYRWNYSSQR